MSSPGELAGNPHPDLQIAVIVPCRNEAASISDVVHNFRAALPSATIFVYDNNSDDETAAIASEAGAIVRSELLPGKGNVVRRMFADINADIYVLVDGDDTYDAASAGMLVEKLESDILDMVSAIRVSVDDGSYRPGHRFGNFFLTGIVAMIFGSRSSDMLSGYRIFSRRFAKSFPALTKGFEIETELTVHALSLNIPVAEVDTPYKDRPEKSASKLNTYSDGLRILWTIFILTKEERPFFFYSIAFGVLAILSLALGVPVAMEFLETGLVPRFPTAILAASIMVLAVLCLTTGLILDSVARGRREAKRLHYLGLTWLGQGRRKSDFGNN